MEAVACWEKCLALDPGFAAAYERLGLLAMKRADYPKAVEMLRKSVSLRPDAPMAQIDLGTALMAAGRLEEAIAVLDRYVGAAVDPTPGLILLGRAHLSLGNWSQARDHYEIAVKLRPQISDGHFGLASAYARLGDAEKARHAMANFKALKADEEKRRKTELAHYDDLDDLRRLMATAYAGAADRCVQSGLASEAASLRRKAQAIAPQMDPGAQRFQGVPSPKSHRY
jgi:tetratricopeptide (TPR) repeat protein